MHSPNDEGQESDCDSDDNKEHYFDLEALYEECEAILPSAVADFKDYKVSSVPNGITNVKVLENDMTDEYKIYDRTNICLLYTSPSPRD